MMNELSCAEAPLPFSRWVRRSWITVAFAELQVALFVIAPQTTSFHDDAKARAKLDVHGYVDQGFVRWRQLHDGCPASIDELWGLPRTPPLTDPWRSRYQMSCDARGIIVWSAGPDGVVNTRDDIRSDE